MSKSSSNNKDYGKKQEALMDRSRKNLHSEEHSPDTALTQEVDLLSLWALSKERSSISDFDAVTEQIHVSPDTLSTAEIELSKLRYTSRP
jgi:hypothetical protein